MVCCLLRVEGNVVLCHDKPPVVGTPQPPCQMQEKPRSGLKKPAYDLKRRYIRAAFGRFTEHIGQYASLTVLQHRGVATFLVIKDFRISTLK